MIAELDGLTREEAEQREDAKPECPHCEGVGWSYWQRVLQCLWYDFQHLEAVRMLLTSPHPIPNALALFAQEIIESGKGWHVQLDQGDVDALVEKDRLWDFTRRPRTAADSAKLRANGYWMTEPNGYRPTAEEVNGWAAGRGMGHDCLNRFIVIEYRLARWDMGDACPHCRGTGKMGGIPWREFEAFYGE